MVSPLLLAWDLRESIILVLLTFAAMHHSVVRNAAEDGGALFHLQLFDGQIRCQLIFPQQSSCRHGPTFSHADASISPAYGSLTHQSIRRSKICLGLLRKEQAAEQCHGYVLHQKQTSGGSCNLLKGGWIPSRGRTFGYGQTSSLAYCHSMHCSTHEGSQLCESHRGALCAELWIPAGHLDT